MSISQLSLVGASCQVTGPTRIIPTHAVCSLIYAIGLLCF